MFAACAADFQSFIKACLYCFKMKLFVWQIITHMYYDEIYEYVCYLFSIWGAQRYCDFDKELVCLNICVYQWCPETLADTCRKIDVCYWPIGYKKPQAFFKWILGLTWLYLIITWLRRFLATVVVVPDGGMCKATTPCVKQSHASQWRGCASHHFGASVDMVHSDYA